MKNNRTEYYNSGCTLICYIRLAQAEFLYWAVFGSILTLLLGFVLYVLKQAKLYTAPGIIFWVYFIGLSGLVVLKILYEILKMSRMRLIVADDAVTVTSGLFPWQRSSYSVSYEAMEEVTSSKNFWDWFFRSRSMRFTARHKAGNIVFPGVPASQEPELLVFVNSRIRKARRIE